MLTIKNYLSRFSAWLWEAKLVWAALFAPLFLLLVLHLAFSASWEQTIRLSGMCLELLGLLTVALGIRSASRFFSRPSLVKIGKTWFGRRPSLQANLHIHAAEASDSVSIAATAEFAWAIVGPGPNATNEERLAILENSVLKIADDLGKEKLRHREEAQAREVAIAQEKQDRETADEKLKKRLEETATSDLHIETLGVWYLGIGIAMATASNEISRLLGLH